MPLEYGTEQDLTANAGLDPHERVNYARFNRMWDWKHDIHYVHQLMTQEVPRVMQIRPKPWIFQADDWGTCPALLGTAPLTPLCRRNRNSHDVRQLAVRGHAAHAVFAQRHHAGRVLCDRNRDHRQVS